MDQFSNLSRVPEKRKNSEASDSKFKRSKGSCQPWIMNLFDSLSEVNYPYFIKQENGQELNFPKVSQVQLLENNEFTSRVNEALSSASGKPFANENLQRAKNWLYFRGLSVSEIATETEPTLAQQIVQYLRGEILHGFYLCTLDGNTVILKGLLLLVVIAHYYSIRITIFSTRSKPIQIVPNGFNYTVALLRHQDSILSTGAWYPLGLAENWVKRAASARATPIAAMVSPPAIQRSQDAAPKRKAAANYKSISDDILRENLHTVM
jgi:hypothetical protein